MIGPLLPKGGYRSLTTQKRLAAKAAAWEAKSTNMVPTATAPKTRGKATEKQLAALAKARAARAKKLSEMESITYSRPIGPKFLTEKQIQGIAKAAATRAAKKAANVGAPKVRRPRLTQEEKALRQLEKDTVRLEKEIAREKKSIEKTAKAIAKAEKKKA